MASKEIKKLRDFPSVEELLQEKQLATAFREIPRPVAARLVKAAIAENKRIFRKGEGKVTVSSLKDHIRQAVLQAARREIRRVINGTGIVVHTNLGRAPLPESLFEAIKQTVTGYGNVEYDLAGGRRGNRGEACEEYLSVLAGSEAATVVNNCAAALFLILNTLANRKKVLISRGDLVQIGGGFRIPDILKRSGARLSEVGATNITTIDDYRNGIDPATKIILRVHKSNFVQAGFTEETPLKDLIALGREHDLNVVNDLGSGVLIPTRSILGHGEPTVQQSVQTGADLTCFSGDKMLGGVQSGLIVGSKNLIGRIKKNPLFRTMRVDKIVFAALERLFTIYLNDSQATDIKLWKILSTPESELYARGRSILKKLGNPTGLSVEATGVYVGGGALPESALPSVGIIFSPPFKATRLVGKFRALDTPIIGRVEDDRFIIDLKAIDVSDFEYLTKAIKEVIALESPA
ncbi:MAG: L-seryl-tRNA(Sec) selenium transferase [candidate division Zixibacteria bacterium]|nr:L-seryl-tRNA(Sec) selenium transferase [candidate division Zixibacteria bacterium]